MVIENETCHVQPRRMLRRCAGLVHARGGHLDGCTLVSRAGGCWWDSLQVYVCIMHGFRGGVLVLQVTVVLSYRLS